MKIKIKDDYIKLDQLLKYANLVETGGMAKIVIQDGLVKVNGVVELRRGKKIRANDIVSYNGQNITVE